MTSWSIDSLAGWNSTAAWCRQPANENLRLMSDRLTPAGVLQWIKQEKEKMRRELAADFRLRSDPKHRLDWDVLDAVERCTRQHCYGEPCD